MVAVGGKRTQAAVLHADIAFVKGVHRLAEGDRDLRTVVKAHGVVAHDDRDDVRRGGVNQAVHVAQYVLEHDQGRSAARIGQGAAVEAEAVAHDADAVGVVITFLDGVLEQQYVVPRTRYITGGLHEGVADLERQCGQAAVVAGRVGVRLGAGAQRRFGRDGAELEDFAQGDADDDCIARCEGVVLNAGGVAGGGAADAHIGDNGGGGRVVGRVAAAARDSRTGQAAGQQPGPQGKAAVALGCSRWIKCAKVLVLRKLGCGRWRCQFRLAGRCWGRRARLGRGCHGGLGRGQRRGLDRSEFAARVEQGRGQHILVLKQQRELRVGQCAQGCVGQHDLLARMEGDDDVGAHLAHAFDIGGLGSNLDRMWQRSNFFAFDVLVLDG